MSDDEAQKRSLPWSLCWRKDIATTVIVFVKNMRSFTAVDPSTVIRVGRPRTPELSAVRTDSALREHRLR